LEDDFFLVKLTRNAFDSDDKCTALGFELNNLRFMGNCPQPVFGKTGFTGTSFICQPQNKLCLVILCNYTYPARKPNADKINEFRASAAELLNNHYLNHLH
jgi:CubicO group peptidase (beta-lactamase class C family)